MEPVARSMNPSRRQFVGSMVGGVLGLVCGGWPAKGVEPAGDRGPAAGGSNLPVRPPALQRGQVAALVSTGEAISVRHKIETLDIAAAALEQAGYRVKIMPHARSREPDHRAGTLEQRVADLNQAFGDPEVR